MQSTDAVYPIPNVLTKGLTILSIVLMDEQDPIAKLDVYRESSEERAATVACEPVSEPARGDSRGRGQGKSKI